MAPMSSPQGLSKRGSCAQTPSAFCYCTVGHVLKEPKIRFLAAWGPPMGTVSTPKPKQAYDRKYQRAHFFLRLYGHPPPPPLRPEPNTTHGPLVGLWPAWRWPSSTAADAPGLDLAAAQGRTTPTATRRLQCLGIRGNLVYVKPPTSFLLEGTEALQCIVGGFVGQPKSRPSVWQGMPSFTSLPPL